MCELLPMEDPITDDIVSNDAWVCIVCVVLARRSLWGYTSVCTVCLQCVYNALATETIACTPYVCWERLSIYDLPLNTGLQMFGGAWVQWRIRGGAPPISHTTLFFSFGWRGQHLFFPSLDVDSIFHVGAERDNKSWSASDSNSCNYAIFCSQFLFFFPTLFF